MGLARLIFIVGIITVISGPLLADESTWLSNQESHWGLSSLKSQLRHPLETMTYVNGKLDIRLWYEDNSVTKGGSPGAATFCRIAHALIFGSYELRSKEVSVPLASAFASNKDLNSVGMTFFAVLYRQRPNTPSLENKFTEIGNSKAPLRVIWTREEQIVPYLSVSISRQEWISLSSMIKKTRAPNFEVFKDTLCEPVLRMTPSLKANFLALTPQAEETINLVIENQDSE